MTDDLGRAARSIGALADELRRRMYLFIRHRGAPVSREEAATETGISSKLAAFHLDKLVEEGLLTAHYARRPGRGGPGAGRSSKLYEPSETSVNVSLPPRAYELVGRMLVSALETKQVHETPEQAARRAGYQAGTELGRTLAATIRSRRAGGRPKRVEQILTELGFEPRREENDILLANCPFHTLAQRNPELVCALNESFLSGVLEGSGDNDLHAVLDPQPGRCCVRLQEVERAS